MQVYTLRNDEGIMCGVYSDIDNLLKSIQVNAPMWIRTRDIKDIKKDIEEKIKYDYARVDIGDKTFFNIRRYWLDDY